MFNLITNKILSRFIISKKKKRYKYQSLISMTTNIILFEFNGKKVDKLTL